MNHIINTMILTLMLPFSYYAYLPQPISPNMIITNLETIMTTKAVTSSIITNMRMELTLDRILLQLSQMNYHSNNYFYISILITYLYGQYKYFEGSDNCNIETKLEKFDKYKNASRTTNEILFILFIIFSKDVPNAI